MPLARSASCRLAIAGVCALATALVTLDAHAEPTAAGARDAPQSSSVYTAPGMLGSVRLAPTVGVGAPDGMRVGAFLKWKGVLSLGGAVSRLPETRIPSVDASIMRSSGEGFMRLHPFQGAYFLGVAGGYAQTNIR